MAFFKKVSKKIVADVKETAIEEAKETGKSILSEAVPVIIAFGIGLAIGIIFRRSPVQIMVVK